MVAYIHIIIMVIISLLQAIVDPGQGWANCILYIFLSPKLRKRMFVLPFQRVWRRLVKKIAQREQTDLETSPFLEATTNPLSRRQSGTTGLGTHTYVSYSTEFTHSSQAE